MKILYIITQGGPWGGAQRYVFDLAVSLKDSNDVAVAVGEPDGDITLQRKLKAAGVRVIQLSHLQRSISVWRDARAKIELWRLYRRERPDIVHLNSSKAGVVGSFARGVRGPKIVYTAHGWIFNEPQSFWKKNIYFALERLSSPFKHAIIVLSSADKRDGLRIATAKKFHIIPLGVDTSDTARKTRNDFLKKTGINLGDFFVFGTVANFYRTKGLDILLRTIRAVRDELADTKFVIIGDGPDRPLLERLLREDKLEDLVKLTGFLEDAQQYLPCFDAFVLPSRKEGLPYTILEAQAAGLPVIAADVGGVSVLVNEKTGYLVPPENIKTLGDALVSARNSKSLKTMGEHGRQAAVSGFNLSQMVERTVEVYRKPA